MTGRQNFCTSRVQAFCSSAVPRPCWGCWANAAVERDADSRVRARRYLRIVVLHSGGRISPFPDSTGRTTGTDCSDGVAAERAAVETAQALVNAAKLAPNPPDRAF